MSMHSLCNRVCTHGVIDRKGDYIFLVLSLLKTFTKASDFGEALLVTDIHDFYIPRIQKHYNVSKSEISSTFLPTSNLIDFFTDTLYKIGNSKKMSGSDRTE